MDEYTLILDQHQIRPLPAGWERWLYNLREQGFDGQYEMFFAWGDQVFLMRIEDLPGGTIYAWALPSD